MPPVTTALIAANVAVYLLQTAAARRSLVPFALWPLGSRRRRPAARSSFEAWQLVTYGFLHGGLTHLAVQHVRAVHVRRRAGAGGRAAPLPRRTTSSACVAAAHHAARGDGASRARSTPPSARRAACSGCCSRTRSTSRTTACSSCCVPFPITARVFVLIYAALELFLGVTGTQEGVAHFAHLGGLAAARSCSRTGAASGLRR